MESGNPSQLQLDEIDWIESNLRLHRKSFILDDYQKKILLSNKNFKIINKSRKIGITTLIAADALFKCMNNPDFLGIIVSKDDRASKYVLSFVDQMLQSFKREIFEVLVDEQSKTEVTFANGSKLICLPCNPNAIRGYDADYIWVDEFAFFNEQEKDLDVRFLAAAVPALSVKMNLHLGACGLCIVSTPNGKKGMFFSIWYEEPSEFEKIKIHWSECKRLYGSINLIKAALPQPQDLWFRQEFENMFEANIQGFIEKELLLLSIDDNLKLEAI